MKKYLLCGALSLLAVFVTAQQTMLIEKVGTRKKYYFKVGDRIKLRVSRNDTLLRGKLWFVADSSISVAELRPFEVRIPEIRSVYKEFYFPKKFGKYMCIGSAAIFTIIGINHLINNEPVFSPDMFYISGALAGTGLISLSLSEKRCRIGSRWKIRILDLKIN